MSRDRGQPGPVLAVVLAGLMVLAVPAAVSSALGTGSVPGDSAAPEPATTATGTPVTLDGPATPTPQRTSGVSVPMPTAPSQTIHAQTALAGDLQAIFSDTSRSRSAAALGGADKVLASRKTMTATGSLNASLHSQIATQRTNVRGARALMSLSDAATEPDSQLTPLPGTVGLTTVGMKLQVAQRNRSTLATAPTSVTLPDPARPSQTSPSAATFALLDRHNVTPTAQQAAKIRALDELPAPTRTALVGVLNAHIAYERATDRAFGEVNLPDRAASNEVHAPANASVDPTRTLGSQRGDIDVARIRAAQLSLLDASVVLQHAVNATDQRGVTGPASHTPGQFPVQAGPVSLDLHVQDNTYEGDYALQIDVGGDDTYDNNAGGAGGTLGSERKTAALFDFGGNDNYTSGDGRGVNGGATFGAGFLHDTAGDDTYDASGVGTNGGGSDGVGFLLDAGGNDAYHAQNTGTNGGSTGGAGFLLDAGGNDTYHATNLGTNGGARDGSGFLMDVSGHDTYLADGRATNGGGNFGGTGFLLDLTGNDTYDATGSGTNGGGKGGSGTLIDVSGNDTYLGGGSGVNGGAARTFRSGGVHGVGLLVDAAGHDTYDAGSQGTNGGAYVSSDDKGGFGTLVDGAGNDSYRGGGDGVNGGVGNSPFSEFPVAVGMLADTGGNDTYTDANGTKRDDFRVNQKGTVGVQVDLPVTSPLPGTRPMTPTPPSDGQKGGSPPGTQHTWPMFGGNPGHTGHVNTTGPTSSITELWRSSPAAEAPAVVDTGQFENHTLYGSCRARDAQTGEERWHKSNCFGFDIPAVVNGTLYGVAYDTSTGDTDLYAVDATTGDERWIFDVRCEPTAPTVAAGTVYFGCGGKVYALDAATGKGRWNNSSVSIEHTVPPAVGDGTVYFGGEDSNVSALDAATGEKRWTVDMGVGKQIEETVTVVNGTVYVGVNDGSEGTLYALNSTTSEEKWTFFPDQQIGTSAAVVNGTVYIGTGGYGETALYALDAQTGNQLWRFPTSSDIESSPVIEEEIHGNFESSPAVVDDTVYVGNTDGNVYALDAFTGDTRWVFDAGKSVRGSPAVVDGVVYFGAEREDPITGSEEVLYALTEEGGQSAPTPTPTPTPTNQPPSVQPRFVTTVNNVGSPLKVTANASDEDGVVANVSLVWSNGTTVDEAHCGASQCTVNLSTVPTNATWNATRDAYDSVSLEVLARDDDGQGTAESVSVRVQIAGDATGDGVVDIFDAVAVGNAWDTTRGEEGYSDAADLTNDGSVDIFDAVQVGNNWENTAANT